MRSMTLKQKIIAVVVGIILAGLAAVKLDIWYTQRQAEEQSAPQTEEGQP